jgi:NADH-quinone oxidoreductase subunit M
VIFGKLEKDDLKAMLDLNWRETAIMVPLVVLVFWMGIYPSSFLDLIHPSVAAIVDQTSLALEAAAAPAQAAASAAGRH